MWEVIQYFLPHNKKNDRMVDHLIHTKIILLDTSFLPELEMKNLSTVFLLSTYGQKTIT